MRSSGGGGKDGLSHQGLYQDAYATRSLCLSEIPRDVGAFVKEQAAGPVVEGRS